MPSKYCYVIIVPVTQSELQDIPDHPYHGVIGPFPTREVAATYLQKSRSPHQGPIVRLLPPWVDPADDMYLEG